MELDLVERSLEVEQRGLKDEAGQGNYVRLQLDQRMVAKEVEVEQLTEFVVKQGLERRVEFGQSSQQT